MFIVQFKSMELVKDNKKKAEALSILLSDYVVKLEMYNKKAFEDIERRYEVLLTKQGEPIILDMGYRLSKSEVVVPRGTEFNEVNYAEAIKKLYPFPKLEGKLYLTELASRVDPSKHYFQFDNREEASVRPLSPDEEEDYATFEKWYYRNLEYKARIFFRRWKSNIFFTECADA